MKLRARAVVCLSVLLLASQLGAFDGQRKGFVLGGGLGVGFLLGQEPDFQNKVAAGVNFKIGYAPSNTLEISYTFAAAGLYQLYYENDDYYSVWVHAVALTYHFNPREPGWFLTGGVGPAMAWGEDNGLGVIAGFGYEVSKRWSIQADVLYANTGEHNEKHTMLRLTLNFLAF